MTFSIVVTAVGRRRYVVEALLNAMPPGCNLYVSDMDPMAPALQVAGIRTFVPSGVTVDQRAAEIVEFCHAEQIDAALSLHDYEGVALSQALSSASVKTRFIGPTPEVARLLLDKVALWKYSRSLNGARTAPTYWADHLPAADSGHGWIVKDRWGSGSSGLSVWPDLNRALKHTKYLTDMRCADWVLQPRLTGVEYNVDVFVHENQIRGHCVKEKLAMRSGETDRARILSTPPGDLLDPVFNLISTLDISGNVDIDVIYGDEGAFLIDVNPRFGGGFAFSSLAGYDAAAALWLIASNKPVEGYMAPKREIVMGKFISTLVYTT
ncbi:ATP-grasp domain-containing protein [Georgenia muralis]